MIIENNLNASQLINDVLLGEGVEAENITINGLPATSISSQLGFFNATNSNIGLNSGIILATGGVSVAESPNDYPTAHVSISENERLDIEPDLQQIMGSAEIKDVGVIEFDFTAKGDTVRFKYVFASEEYNEHVCSSYNDGFGFFISGPGIVGNPNYANQAKNVALIPGTTIPVAINTVNSGFPGDFGNAEVCNALSENWQNNHIYFVNNESNSSANATQFDGFTVPLLIEIPVICGVSYHIKMAIADATDRKNDSAVFIEGGSFSSNPPLKAQVEILNPDPDGLPLEGCSTYRFTLSRKDSTRSQTYYIASSGLENADQIIPGLPDSISLYMHDGVKSFDVELQNDAIPNGLRNFEVHFSEPEACSSDTLITTLELTLTDNPNMAVSYNPNITLNCVETANIDIAVSGGMPSYNIIWNNSDYQGFNFNAAPESQVSLSAIVTDFCSVNSQEIQIEISRQNYAALAVTVPNQVSYNCVNPVSIIPNVQGGFGEYTFEWMQNDEVIFSGLHFNQIVDSPEPITVSVSDLCVPTLSKSINVSQQLSPINLELGEDKTGDCHTSYAIIPQLEGGFGTLTYLWKVNNVAVSNQPSLLSKFIETSTILLTVTDACGTEESDQMAIFINTPQLSVLLPEDTALCKNESLFLSPIIVGGYGEQTYFWNNEISEVLEFNDIPSGNILKFKVEDACGYVVEKQCNIEIRDVLASFEFNYEDNLHPIVNNSTIDAWYDWFFPDETGSNAFEPSVNFETLKGGATTVLVRNQIGCEAEATRNYDPPFRVFLPNAFTPDGDGLNDVFKAEGQYIDSFELMVFNRWGKMIFRTTDISEGWNGEGADENYTGEDHPYSYRYIAKDAFGRVDEGIGVVNLLR